MKNFRFIWLLLSVTPLLGMEEQPEQKKAKTEEQQEVVDLSLQPKSLKDTAGVVVFCTLAQQPHLDERLTPQVLPEELIERYINQPNSLGHTPIFFSAEENIPTMIAKGASIEHKDKVNRATPLDYFITHGFFKTALKIVTTADVEALKRSMSYSTFDKLLKIGKFLLRSHMSQEDKKLLLEPLKSLTSFSVPYASTSKIPLEEIKMLLTIFSRYEATQFKRPSTTICNVVGRTPFHLTRSEQEIKEWLDRGYDINAQDLFGNTPLAYQLQHNRPHCVKALLDAGADTSKENCYNMLPIEYAIKLGYNELLPQLLDEKTLNYLSENNNPPDAPDDDYNKPNKHLSLLEFSAKHNNTRAMQMLLDADIGNHICKEQALFRSLYNRNLYGTRLLLNEEDIDINATENNFGHTFLAKAMESFPETIPLFLAQKGIDINLTDGYNQPPWEVAIIDENLFDAFKQIISSANNINLQNSNHETPLMIAAQHRNASILRYLLENNADCMVKDNEDSTVLHYAAEYYNNDNLDVLLSHIQQRYHPHTAAALINAQDRRGKTALMYSAKYYPPYVKLLLAQPTIALHTQDRHGRNALELAIRNLHAKSVKLLLNAGCTLNSPAHTVELITKPLSTDHVDLIKVEEASFTDGLGSTTFEDYYDARLNTQQRITKIISHFIQKGMSIDTTNNHGETILEVAIKNYHVNVVKHAIALGANTQANSSEGKTFLSLAEEIFKTIEQKYNKQKETPALKISGIPQKTIQSTIEKRLLELENKLNRAKEIVLLLQENAQ